MAGPAPAKPQRPQCDFDIPENTPVFDAGRSEAVQVEDKAVDDTFGDVLPPILLGAKEDDRLEAELQLRLAHDYRLLEDSALALKSLVVRELDAHRQLTEKLITRQHDRTSTVLPSPRVTGVVRRPVSHVLETPPVFDSAAGGGAARKSSAMGRDCSTAYESSAPQGTDFGHADSNSTHGQSEKQSVYQDLRNVAHMAFAATQALVPSRRTSRDTSLDHLERQLSPASPRELEASQPRDSDLSMLQNRQGSAGLFMEHVKISGMPTWACDKKRNEITDSYNRMKIHGRKSGQVLLGWAGFEDVVDNNRSWEETMAYGRNSCLCNMLRELIKSHAFSSTIASLILLNAIFIGVAADATLRRLSQKYEAGETPLDLSDASEPWERAIDLAFTSIFGLELILRIFAFQFTFFVGPEWRWNMLDSCIVLLAFFELVLQHYSFGESWARLFRLVRLARSMRVLRVFRFFRQLRLMLISVLSSLIPLLWAVVFLLLVLFVFSVLISYGVSQWFAEVHKDQVDGDVSEQILTYFGDMSMVLISHFIAVTGGISWWELATLLKEISWAYVVVFIVYVTVTMLMVLNIITGIFVNDSIEIAQTDREFASEALMQKEKNVFKELERTFHELDVDGDGLLYFDEFEQKVKDPIVRAVFSALHLDVTDALRFFRLLDVDKSNAVEIDEFVMGCMNIKGQVGTISLEAMMAENKRMMRGYLKAQRKLEEVVNKHFTAMQATLKDRSLVPSEYNINQGRIDEPKHRGASFVAS